MIPPVRYSPLAQFYMNHFVKYEKDASDSMTMTLDALRERYLSEQEPDLSPGHLLLTGGNAGGIGAGGQSSGGGMGMGLGMGRTGVLGRGSGRKFRVTDIDFHDLTSDNMMTHIQNVFLRHAEDLKLLLAHD